MWQRKKNRKKKRKDEMKKYKGVFGPAIEPPVQSCSYRQGSVPNKNSSRLYEEEGGQRVRVTQPGGLFCPCPLLFARLEGETPNVFCSETVPRIVDGGRGRGEDEERRHRHVREGDRASEWRTPEGRRRSRRKGQGRGGHMISW